MRFSKDCSMDSKQEFAGFMGGFIAQTGPTNRILEFDELLAKFELISAADAPKEAGEVAQEMLHEFLHDFEQKLREYLSENAESAPTLNVWTIADLGDGEVQHCKVLKWFLDPNETHCQGTCFLNCLLQTIGENPWTEKDGRIRVYREVTMEGGDSRVDITIESSFIVLWIEAKTRAEGDLEQLDRYSERARARLGDRRFIGKLLEECGTSREPLTAEFTRLLWSDVEAALRLFGAENGTPSAAKNPFVAKLAKQYADFIDSHVRKKGQRK